MYYKFVFFAEAVFVFLLDPAVYASRAVAGFASIAFAGGALLGSFSATFWAVDGDGLADGNNCLW